MAKTLSYILMIIGIIIGIAPFVFKSTIAGISFLAGLNSYYYIIAGIILIILGFVFMKGKSKQGEVPIYKGNQVVGYRRH